MSAAGGPIEEIGARFIDGFNSRDAEALVALADQAEQMLKKVGLAPEEVGGGG